MYLFENKTIPLLMRLGLPAAKWRCLLSYREKFGVWPDLKHPKDLNEKILWLEFNTDTSRWTELADKWRVRDYVKGKGLERLLIKSYGGVFRPGRDRLFRIARPLCDNDESQL